MKPSPELLDLLATQPGALAISGEAALAFVSAEQRKGGWLPTLGVSTLVFGEFFCLVSAPAMPSLLIVALALAVPLRYLLKRGYRSAREARAIRAAAALPPPLSAVLVDHTLLLGTSGAPPEQWCAVPVTASEKRKIHLLTLPSARLRDAG